MNIIKNIFVLISPVLVSSSFAQTNFKEYYYPVRAKKEVKIYKYVDKNNQSNIEYWKVTTSPETNRIITASYTTDRRLYNIFEEELKTDGAELVRYTDFEISDTGENVQIDGIVVDKDVYKWKDKNKYRYSIKYKSPKYGNELFTKERTVNSFEKIIVSGIEYATLKFRDEYEVKSLENNQYYKFHQFTYYAKDIGMIKYERYHPDGTTIELELRELLTLKQFEKLIKKS